MTGEIERDKLREVEFKKHQTQIRRCLVHKRNTELKTSSWNEGIKSD